MNDASVDVERTGSHAVRIVLDGEIDLANVGTVEAQLLEAISNQLVDVTVDLTGVSYIDSAGLRVLFLLGARLETLQIGFHLVVPPDSAVRKVVDLSGIAAIASVEDAPRPA
ncbi:MAG TPA: STAS domain-containing protein [Pseudonocardia sp.]|nr:STAS domain-containing protein [Pseudonocardia sp.]